MVKVRGEWALDLDYNSYQETVLKALAKKPTKLTGNEVQFIRKYFQLTIRGFAERFSIRHPTVVKWENASDDVTKMSWTTEKDIRLFIVDELQNRASELHKLYRMLIIEALNEYRPILVDIKKMAA